MLHLLPFSLRVGLDKTLNFLTLLLLLTLYIYTITRLNFPLEANYNTGQFSPFRVGSNLDSRSESEGSSRG